MRYAEVAVKAPVHPRLSRQTAPSDQASLPRRATFHYLVPPHLAGRIRCGQWVWVPFGSRHLSGIVVALDTPPPAGVGLRQIVDIVDDRPVATPTQLSLAVWMSNYYLTPLFDCLKLFLPPGAMPQVETVYRPGEEQDLDLDASEREVVGLLRQHGALTREELERMLSEAAVGEPRKPLGLDHKVLEHLVQRGAVVPASRLSPPSVGAQYQPMVTLSVPVREALRLLAEASARHPSARALLLLAQAQEEGDPLVPLERVQQQTGLSTASLRRLVREGLLNVSEPTSVLAVSPSGIGCPSGGAAPRGDGLGAEARALIEPLQRGGPQSCEELQARGYSLTQVQELVAAGLLEELPVPAWVSLALPAEDAWRRVLDMAHLKAARQVLQALEESGRPMWLEELLAAAQSSRAGVDRLVQVGAVTVEQRRLYRDPLAELSPAPAPLPRLTEEQEALLQPIVSALEKRHYRAFLLHGVTGSGKTEIYLKAIERTLALGRQAIVLVPEIALTPQTVRRFVAAFPGRVALQHSQLSQGERYDQWSQIREGTAQVVVGPRSALFAPVPTCGLIVVDEEHERSYKQESRPYYHAVRTALQLGWMCDSVVILGSATPDVCTYRAAERGEVQLLSLPRRYGADRQAPMPPVQIVDMRQELRQGHTGLLSRPLLQSLGDVLARGEQAILFLNRRGSATFIMCRDCGYVMRCPKCDLPLTHHRQPVSRAQPRGGARRAVKGTADRGDLVCHHCNYTTTAPRQCPHCSSARIRYFGAGTERLQSYTESLFPQARIIRWDRDTTRQRGGHEAILRAFLDHEADVLIGTQMVAKGLDLPLVTLVGVVTADTAIFLPDFRSGERAFQLLTQVAGRAGRSEREGRAIIQTYHPDHYAIQAAARHDYQRFYRHEIEWRRRLGYPPFGDMVRLLCAHRDQRRCQAAAHALATRLRLRIREEGLPNLEVMGPSPCFYPRLRGRYRWHIILRGQGIHELLRREPLPVGWRVDVDPMSFL